MTQLIRQSLVAYGAPLCETVADSPEPRGTEVLVRIERCGVCHSDLHVQDGYFKLGGDKTLDIAKGRTLPFTLGHEIAGVVERAGPDAVEAKAGAKVAVYPWIGCGQCIACRHGEENNCAASRHLGVNLDGGYASHVLVPHPRYLIDYAPLSASFAGALMCSGLTAYAALQRLADRAGRGPVLLIGLGGVGSMGFAFARALFGTAPLVADIDAAKRNAALAAGAAGAPGRKIVLFDPSSPLFSLGAKSRRATIRWVTTSTEDGKLRFNVDTLTKALRGATLLAMADPCNPTGGTLAAEDLEKIAWAAKRMDVLIYLDESFARFRYDQQAKRLLDCPDAAGRTLTAGSLTQGDGLGSVRVGWLSGPKHLVRACTLTASLNAPYVPTICQQIALRAVQADEDLFGPIQEEFRDRRRYAFDKLKATGLNPAWPAGGFFFWVPVNGFGLDGRSFAERLLNKQKVLVGPGNAFGPSGKGFVRISFAAEDGRLREGLARLSTFMASIGGKPIATSPRVTNEPAVDAEVVPPTFSRV